MSNRYNIAIDLGGTIIKIGLILHGEIVRFCTVSSDSVKGLAAMLPKIETARLLEIDGKPQLIGV